MGELLQDIDVCTRTDSQTVANSLRHLLKIYKPIPNTEPKNKLWTSVTIAQKNEKRSVSSDKCKLEHFKVSLSKEAVLQ